MSLHYLKFPVIFLLLLLASTLYAQPPEAGVRKNVGPNINTQWDDINPIISADGKTLYFARKNYPLNRFAQATPNTLDIWYSELQPDSTWSVAKDFTGLNIQYDNGICTVLPDNNTMLYLWATDAQGRQTFGLIHRTPKGWTLQPLNIKNFIYESGTTISGTLAADGKTLMLAYKRSGGQSYNNPATLPYAGMNIEGMNIYVSFLEEEEKNIWSDPKNLGDVINSSYSEFEPLLAPDGVTLFFSSARPGGIGDVDIYMSRRLDSTWTNWSPPVDLGEGFNIPGYNAINSITASGDYAYITGMVQNPLKNMDIFRVKMPERFHIKPVALVKGRVFARLQTATKAAQPDSGNVVADTTKPLFAKIVYERLSDGKQMGIAHTNPQTGEYEIALPCGDNYGFRAERDGYLPVNDNLDLSKITSYQELRRDIVLTPFAAGSNIILNNLFFDEGKAGLRSESFPELDRLVDFMKQYSNVKVEIDGHTDDVGTPEFNNALSLQRAQAVVKYLTSHGINNKRVAAKGFGLTQPIASNDTDEGKQKNRRVVMKVVNK